jgi:hypothetical protein
MLPLVTGGLVGKAALAGLEAVGGPLLAEAGKAIASAVDPAARAYQGQIKRDIRALQRGKLGLSEAEKRTMLAGTQRALQAQTSALEANLRRSAAAQGGFGRSGAQQAALGQLAAGQRETMAGAAGKVDALSQEVAQRRFADVMNRLAQQRAEARQTGATLAAGAGGGLLKGMAAYNELKEKEMEKLMGEVEADAKLREAKAAQGMLPGAGTVVK